MFFNKKEFEEIMRVPEGNETANKLEEIESKIISVNDTFKYLQEYKGGLEVEKSKIWKELIKEMEVDPSKYSAISYSSEDRAILGKK